MNEIENIDKNFEKNIINDEQKRLLKEYVTRLRSNNIPIIYNLRHLRKLLQITKADQPEFFGPSRQTLYRTFYIAKKSGGYRKIEAPIEKLELIQRWIKEEILDKFVVSDCAKGFKKGTNIVDNALPHCGKQVVLSIDIKDFFPSIKYADVFKMFNYMGYTYQVCHLLTKLCTNGNNVLPQGSPASPSISNLVNLKLDKRLAKLAESIGASYTRYADDITFSGNKSLVRYKKIIEQIINEEHYEINHQKQRLSYNYQRQEVTGLIVNNGVSVNKKILKELNNAIYYIEKFGLISHMQHENLTQSSYKEHLYGLAYFVNMVDQEKGEYYIHKLNQINWQS